MRPVAPAGPARGKRLAGGVQPAAWGVLQRGSGSQAHESRPFAQRSGGLVTGIPVTSLTEEKKRPRPWTLAGVRTSAAVRCLLTSRCPVRLPLTMRALSRRLLGVRACPAPRGRCSEALGRFPGSPAGPWVVLRDGPEAARQVEGAGRGQARPTPAPATPRSRRPSGRVVWDSLVPAAARGGGWPGRYTLSAEERPRHDSWCHRRVAN